MEPADAQALSARLAEKRIPNEISPDGRTVSVPADQLNAARLELASREMPRSGRLGFELFDKLSWGQTEFDEKVNYQRALEGELERTIQTLRDVESVRVHLVMPADSLFLDRERSAKASVILNLRGRMSPELQLAIARLVSGAVDRLSPESVTVIDANNNRSASLPRQDPFSPAGNLDQELAARIRATLEPMTGVDRVRASVNVDYDTSSSEENQETYDPKAAVAVSTQRSDEQIGGGLAGGVPGTATNVPNASGNVKVTAQLGEGSQVSHSDSSTYAVSKVVRHTIQPAGRIRRISAALVVDDAVETTQDKKGKRIESRRKRTPEELKQIQELAQAAIGFDAARGDTLTVQNLSFREPEVEKPRQPNVAERVQIALHDWSSLVRYGSLLLLFLLAYGLLLRPVKKQVLATLKQLPARKAAVQKEATALGTLPAASGSELISGLPDLQQALALKKQLVDKVKAEPTATTRLVQNWLREGSQ
jgi:flagellar M-ring protein FliF